MGLYGTQWWHFGIQNTKLTPSGGNLAPNSDILAQKDGVLANNGDTEFGDILAPYDEILALYCDQNNNIWQFGTQRIEEHIMLKGENLLIEGDNLAYSGQGNLSPEFHNLGAKLTLLWAKLSSLGIELSYMASKLSSSVPHCHIWTLVSNLPPMGAKLCCYLHQIVTFGTQR